mmetsp:Transcript_22777/g.58309  ORF Transcript_22777/g.58309 Transcript_22777/m.58309 type:complete len:261 (+) Transcript_22777:3-785(+)
MPPPLPPPPPLMLAAWVPAVGALMGFTWCFCACAGCGFGKRTPAFRERYKLFPAVVILTCIITASVFWFVLEPEAVSKKASIVGWGALGDAVGVFFGIVLCHIYKPKTPKTQQATAASPPPADTPAPVTLSEVVVAEAVQPADGVSVSATPVAGAIATVAGMSVPAGDSSLPIAAGAVVVGCGSAHTGGGSSGGENAMPVVKMVEVFKRELGVKGSNLTQLVDAACAELGVPVAGGLVERAMACMAVLHGPGGGAAPDGQ